MKKHLFKSIESLQEQLSKHEPFYLHFLLAKGEEVYLKETISLTLHHRLCIGFVFEVDTKNFSYVKLFFVKTWLEKVLLINKPLEIIGIPKCVLRTLFGGYMYMRWEENQRVYLQNSVQKSMVEKTFLPICDKCVDKEDCLGTSNIDIPSINPIIKRELSSIFKNKIQPFDEKHYALNDIHQAFLDYCVQTKSKVSYRSVYYVSNIDFHSEHSYANRFVYGCDYLSPQEYAQEFSFLRAHVIYGKFIDTLASVAAIECTSQIAYSLAQKAHSIRESFYMFVSKEYGDKILKDFSITYVYPKSLDMPFIGVGIDVIANEIEGYKLYFRATKTFLKNYVHSFDIDITQLHYTSHYLVLRLDKQQQCISYKIEMLLKYHELHYFKNVIDNYAFYTQTLNENGTYNIAIEIEENSITKINIYHRSYIDESKKDDV